LHTPGHRPEHTAFVLTDTSRGPEPWAVLSGDTLFVGDIGRPDLAVDKRQGAAGIFHSLRDALLELPDDCEVWPGHLGGSLCGGPGMDMKVASTIGYECHHQELLAIEDEDEFVTRTTAALGPHPPNFENIVALNQGPLRYASAVAPAVAPGQLAQHNGSEPHPRRPASRPHRAGSRSDLYSLIVDVMTRGSGGRASGRRLQRQLPQSPS
jgi:hydroxyacylglutathione hydrolase